MLLAEPATGDPSPWRIFGQPDCNERMGFEPVLRYIYSVSGFE